MSATEMPSNTCACRREVVSPSGLRELSPSGGCGDAANYFAVNVLAEVWRFLRVFPMRATPQRLLATNKLVDVFEVATSDLVAI
jgi:hypothetical protein